MSPRNINPLPEDVVLPARPLVGQMRQMDGRSEMFDGSLWLCAEPLLNEPEGMCCQPAPCELHPGEK